MPEPRPVRHPDESVDAFALRTAKWNRNRLRKGTKDPNYKPPKETGDVDEAAAILAKYQDVPPAMPGPSPIPEPSPTPGISIWNPLTGESHPYDLTAPIGEQDTTKPPSLIDEIIERIVRKPGARKPASSAPIQIARPRPKRQSFLR